MKNKTFIFFIVSIALVLIKSILIDTISFMVFLFSIILLWVVVYYAWVKWLKHLYPDFKNWFEKDVTFLWIFFIFLLFIIPLSSADKCLEDDWGEIFAWSIEYHCIEYNPDYKKEYTWINYFSYIVYLLIALYFYLLDKPKNIAREKEVFKSIPIIEEEKKLSKKKKISKKLKKKKKASKKKKKSKK